MAHELEMREDGTAAMAYVGEKPWHNLGSNLLPGATPVEFLKAAGLDWEVKKAPAYAMVDDQKIFVGRSALYRTSDNRVLDVVGDDWNPVQNLEAASFFNEFTEEGHMAMETAGSLRNGQIVWFLAKVNESFEAVAGDRVDGYMLFTNPHKFGQTTSVQFNPIRVVCANTLALAMSQQVRNIVRVSHRKEFNGDEVKSLLGIAKDKLLTYKETAQFLCSKKATKEKTLEYFKLVFPVVTAGEKETTKVLSKNASRALDILSTQPGAEFAEGSYWSLFNCCSYMIDHVIGRSVDNRLASAWYGPNRQVKLDAMKLAVTMAEKSGNLAA